MIPSWLILALALLVMTGVAHAQDEPARPQKIETWLADLTPELREALAQLDPPVANRTPQEQLQAVFEAGAAYEFPAGVLTAYTDQRWFASVSTGGAEAPLLELRRWPGDTILLLYAIAGPLSAQREATPPVPGAELTLDPQSTEDLAEWRGTLATDAGPRPAVWVEIRVPDAPAFLGALMLPGDAGLGSGAVGSLMTELRALLGRVVIREDLWKRKLGLPHGTQVLIGATGSTPDPKDENRDPWQVATGGNFTIGMPPGFQARRMDAEVPPPVKIPGGLLWLRGRYVDQEGTEIIVGDGERAGYVAHVTPSDPEWVNGKQPPVAAPDATSLASQSYPVVREQAGALGGLAQRWKEPGFDGEWLVFRLFFNGYGMEVGLPVLAGRRSESLFWVPVTFRGTGLAPAPPPVDPAQRFGIRFERLSRGEKAKRPWMEGFLFVPGLSVELPVNWWPAASLRSDDGYPIRLLDQRGPTMGLIDYIPANELTTPEGEGWEVVSRAKVHRAAKYYRHADGTLLFVATEGHAFVFVPDPDGGTPEQPWSRMAESVQLLKAESSPKK